MTIAEKIELACLMESTARKPGNVHPAASFQDLRYEDFVLAARAIATPLAEAPKVGLGQAIFDATNATRALTGTNVNLGIVLLFAPLASVPDELPLESGIGQVLNRTTIEDAEHVFNAIRLAQPGGMGGAPSQDIRDRPTVTLREAMKLAADRDRIAEQYVSNFSLVFEARNKLCDFFLKSTDWESAIILLQLWIMSKCPDTLIARKCGQNTAGQASVKAATLVASIEATGNVDPGQLKQFDDWLRADGHRRNPGTTADLIAAALFAALRDGLIEAPSNEEVQQFASSLRQGSLT